MAAPDDAPAPRTETRTWLVEHRLTVAAHGSVDLPVLATPHLVFMLEDTCVFVAQPLLAEGMLTVGTEVHVFHLAAAREGETVETYAELLEVQGRRYRFKVEARCKDVVVARGTHERAAVNAAEFRKRLGV